MRIAMLVIATLALGCDDDMLTKNCRKVCAQSGQVVASVTYPSTFRSAKCECRPAPVTP